ncbi:ferredoxin [Phytohabitans sp. LJ34]|uniref:ferredoxin n=1 Tax=Phytohabitans sp. LJ34 TaxID=3452217 RepID=UPI003F8C4B2D
MKVAADRITCLGMGLCEVTAPGVFEVGDDGAVLVLAEHVAPDQLDTVTAAVEGCPTEALSLIQD